MCVREFHTEPVGRSPLPSWDGELERRARARLSLVGWGGVNCREGSWQHPSADPEQLGEPCKVKSLNCLFTEEETQTDASLDLNHSTSVAGLGAMR